MKSAIQKPFNFVAVSAVISQDEQPVGTISETFLSKYGSFTVVANVAKSLMLVTEGETGDLQLIVAEDQLTWGWSAAGGQSAEISMHASASNLHQFGRVLEVVPVLLLPLVHDTRIHAHNPEANFSRGSHAMICPFLVWESRVLGIFIYSCLGSH